MSPTAGSTPPRHELPEIDGPAFVAARAVERLLDEARALDAERWVRYFATLPDRLRDDPLPALRTAARHARAAYGPRDSVRDSLPPEVTEPVLDAVDRLIRAINRRDANRS